uniref:Uncharacterized protein n=1 Tax=Anguilla anguilla TaxID=7936 RepID=A0A0E9XRV5_ANGAN
MQKSLWAPSTCEDQWSQLWSMCPMPKNMMWMEISLKSSHQTRPTISYKPRQKKNAKTGFKPFKRSPGQGNKDE